MKFHNAVAVFALSLVLGAIACFPKTTNNNENTNIFLTGPNGGGSASPGAPTPGPCPAVDQDPNTKLEGATSLAVGQAGRLDLTAFALGIEVSGFCAQSKNPTWTDFVPAGIVRFTTSRTGFNPEVLATAIGTASTTATIDGRSSTLSITVK